MSHKIPGAANNSNRSNKRCSHCNTPGHQESECWRKHPDQMTSWVKKKDRELAGLALEGETAFNAIDDDVLVETVREEEIIINKHEDMPSLQPRILNDEDISEDEDEASESDEENINWNSEDELIPEFWTTY